MPPRWRGWLSKALVVAATVAAAAAAWHSLHGGARDTQARIQAIDGKMKVSAARQCMLVSCRLLPISKWGNHWLRENTACNLQIFASLTRTTASQLRESYTTDPPAIRGCALQKSCRVVCEVAIGMAPGHFKRKRWATPTALGSQQHEACSCCLLLSVWSPPWVPADCL